MLRNKRPQAAIAVENEMATIPNPMAATWQAQDPKTWTWQQRALARLDNWHNDRGEFPVFKKTDKLRWFSQASVTRWILMHAAWPVVIHAAWNHFLAARFGRFPHVLVFGLYTVASMINLRLETRCLNNVARE